MRVISNTDHFLKKVLPGVAKPSSTVVCMCVFICMCVCVCLCVYVWIYLCVCVCIHTGSGSGVGSGTLWKVGSGSGIGSEKNHSGSTTLIKCAREMFYIQMDFISFRANLQKPCNKLITKKISETLTTWAKDVNLTRFVCNLRHLIAMTN